jgi:hypothetical protein
VVEKDAIFDVMETLVIDLMKLEYLKELTAFNRVSVRKVLALRTCCPLQAREK